MFNPPIHENKVPLLFDKIKLIKVAEGSDILQETEGRKWHKKRWKRKYQLKRASETLCRNHMAKQVKHKSPRPYPSPYSK